MFPQHFGGTAMPSKVNKTFQPHFILFHSSLSFFNFTFPRKNRKNFAQVSWRVENDGSESFFCYHFSKACFMASVFARNFLQFKVLYLITHCQGGENWMLMRMKLMGLKLYKFYSMLRAGKRKRMDGMYWKQITFRTDFVLVYSGRVFEA